MTDSPGDAAAKAAADKAAAADADAKAKADAKAEADAAKAASAIVKNSDGSPVVDFTDYESAAAQAKAIGKGASVVAVGVAYTVVKG